jgi:asparagine synthase (glutamine-hydrolysing)
LEYGLQFLERLNGMFTIAIYDSQRKELVLARDRLGQKPLFYWLSKGKLSFASELRALRFLPDFPHEIAPKIVGLYLRLGWVPGWTSIHKNVSKLPPASWLRFDIGSGRCEGPVKYWSLPPLENDYSVKEEEWLDRIDELLSDAVRIRLRSDVPLGVFLSGGIDSGLIAAIAAKQTNNNIGSLTVGFPEWAGDEWHLARETARYIGVDSIHEALHSYNGISQMPAVMGHFDEPFADSSAVPTALICQTARKHFTVALSGDGGDEIFAGYENHLRAWRWRFLDRVPSSVKNNLSRFGESISRPDTKLRRFSKRLRYQVGILGMGSKLYPLEDWLDEYLQPEFQLTREEIEREYYQNVVFWPHAEALEQAQRTDLRLYMVDDILVKVDRMSMRHSLEVRSPFLDYRIVELSLRIPQRIRVRNGKNKYLLRRLAGRYLPENVIQAPKRGFGVPLRNWLFFSDQSPAFLGSLSTVDPKLKYNPLISGAGTRFWNEVKNNPSLTPALFRILSYFWWEDANIS